MIYLDSCALVKLVHVESETAALQAYLDDRNEELVTCELALAEVLRVVRRVNHDNQRRLLVGQSILEQEMAVADDLLSRIGKVIVDEAVFVAAGASDLDPHLGTLDAIHLVSAQILGPAVSTFVTYDRALGRVAAEAGFDVASPR